MASAAARFRPAPRPRPTGPASDGSWARIAACRALQLRRRIEAQLVGEQRPRAGVGTQRRRLAPRAVQGEHQPAHEPLAQRVLVGHPLEPGGRLGGPAQRQQGVEAGLGRARSRSSSHRTLAGARPLLVGDVGEARPAPLAEGGVEQLEGGGRVVVERAPSPRRRRPRSGGRRASPRSTSRT